MIRWIGTAGFALVVPFLQAQSCGSDLGSRGFGEPCTRNRDCIDDAESDVGDVSDAALDTP